MVICNIKRLSYSFKTRNKIIRAKFKVDIASEITFIFLLTLHIRDIQDMLCKIITLPDIKRNMNFNILFSQVGTIILNAIQKLSIHEIHNAL